MVDGLSSRISARGVRPAFMSCGLYDVNLVIDQGETVGLMGRNGSGKSTMLRVIAGVTAPTEGWSRTRGHVGSLLEVGAGFYDELSGRDNIYLNAALLGRRPAEVARRFDDIVEFSGIAHMLDTPTRRYSSGQFMRLAFAVAAHLDSEIMLVDEVLAVGDREFSRSRDASSSSSLAPARPSCSSRTMESSCLSSVSAPCGLTAARSRPTVRPQECWLAMNRLNE